MNQVKVTSLGLDKASNTPVVILQEMEGDRVLPIWIGPGEASAIAMELAGMRFSRPLTHDLFTALLQGLNTELQRVLITKVVDNTYHAELILRRDGDMVSIDARPSDSIAIALRAKAPIYAHDDLLEEASIEVQHSEIEPGQIPDALTESEETGGMNAEQLKEYLKRMNPEDFGRFKPLCFCEVVVNAAGARRSGGVSFRPAPSWLSLRSYRPRGCFARKRELGLGFLHVRRG
jgi:bifunctional DNase/RNase